MEIILLLTLSEEIYNILLKINTNGTHELCLSLLSVMLILKETFKGND